MDDHDWIGDDMDYQDIKEFRLAVQERFRQDDNEEEDEQRAAERRAGC